ncbi:beta-ketoacyl-[acyl-carrier-protein] synthase family protein [Pseudomonas sp. BF-R-26]|uniref:beta-ketoacyl-[acyl-carrier-protein] synthase family protein n=1 Tax=Pseudomonas sp. BF-R-26 TaxID=2832398 RepID=UPI001CC1B09F|nr:beta-ketoacyl-[acyl-carrier-protein] synthase family protein [Pseudomonas sp. BF-R-26]
MKSSDKGRRVVVTGLGPVSPIGVGKAAFFHALKTGVNGTGLLSKVNTDRFERKYGCEVKSTVSTLIPDFSSFVRSGTPSHFALAATGLALADAGIKRSAISGKRVNCYFGTTYGESNLIDNMVTAMAESRPGLQASVQHTFASEISRDVLRSIGSTGEAVTIGNACSASNTALIFGYEAIKAGDCELAICGGSDAVYKATFATFHRLGSMTDKNCTPFNSGRKGVLTAEGGSALVLEDYDQAMRRGAHIYAEVLGFSMNCDADHMVRLNHHSVGDCMKSALENASVTPGAVGYICAHGTGTVANDSNEYKAIEAVFGHSPPPVSSIKSMMGHSMGAAAGFGAIACMLALSEGLPPTINVSEQDLEIPIDVVAEGFRVGKVDVVVNNAFAFGGNNSILVFGNLK